MSHLTPLHLQTMTLFGDYGTGKTSIALGNPKALYYDLEDGLPTQFEGKIDLLDVPRDWPSFQAKIGRIYSGEDTTADDRTLVIDTVTDLWKLCERHNLEERGLKNMPRDDYGRTLTEIRQDFEDVFNMLLMLRMKRRMGTIFIAHEDVIEIETDTQVVRTSSPKVADKHVKTLIGAKPQLVLRTFVADEHPKTLVPFDEPKFLILTKRLTAQDKVKDRTGQLPQLVTANWDSLARAYAGEKKAPAKPKAVA